MRQIVGRTRRCERFHRHWPFARSRTMMGTIEGQLWANGMMVGIVVLHRLMFVWFAHCTKTDLIARGIQIWFSNIFLQTMYIVFDLRIITQFSSNKWKVGFSPFESTKLAAGSLSASFSRSAFSAKNACKIASVSSGSIKSSSSSIVFCCCSLIFGVLYCTSDFIQ